MATKPDTTVDVHPAVKALAAHPAVQALAQHPAATAASAAPLARQPQAAVALAAHPATIATLHASPAVQALAAHPAVQEAAAKPGAHPTLVALAAHPSTQKVVAITAATAHPFAGNPAGRRTSEHGGNVLLSAARGAPARPGFARPVRPGFARRPGFRHPIMERRVFGRPASPWFDAGWRAANPAFRWQWDRAYRFSHMWLVPEGWVDPYEGLPDPMTFLDTDGSVNPPDDSVNDDASDASDNGNSGDGDDGSDTGDTDGSGAYRRPAPPTRGGGYGRRPRPPMRGGYVAPPYGGGFIPGPRHWAGRPGGWASHGTPVFGLPGTLGGVNMSDMDVNALEAASSAPVDPDQDPNVADASQAAEGSATSGRGGGGGGFHGGGFHGGGFHGGRRRRHHHHDSDTMNNPGSEEGGGGDDDSSGIRHWGGRMYGGGYGGYRGGPGGAFHLNPWHRELGILQAQEAAEAEAEAEAAALADLSDASGAGRGGWGGRSYDRGWGGAGRGFGRWGGIWPGAYVPVWNPDGEALLDEGFSADDAVGGFDLGDALSAAVQAAGPAVQNAINQAAPDVEANAARAMRNVSAQVFGQNVSPGEAVNSPVVRTFARQAASAVIRASVPPGTPANTYTVHPVVIQVARHAQQHVLRSAHRGAAGRPASIVSAPVVLTKTPAGWTMPVSVVQSYLVNLAILPPTSARTGKPSVDGMRGAETDAAVKAFQVKEGLPATGVVDAQTAAAFNLPYGANAVSGVSWLAPAAGGAAAYWLAQKLLRAKRARQHAASGAWAPGGLNPSLALMPGAPTWTFIRFSPAPGQNPDPSVAMGHVWPVRVLQATPHGKGQWHVQVVSDVAWQPPDGPVGTELGTLQWKAFADVTSGYEDEPWHHKIRRVLRPWRHDHEQRDAEQGRPGAPYQGGQGGQGGDVRAQATGLILDKLGPGHSQVNPAGVDRAFAQEIQANRQDPVYREVVRMLRQYANVQGGKVQIGSRHVDAGRIQRVLQAIGGGGGGGGGRPRPPRTSGWAAPALGGAAALYAAQHAKRWFGGASSGAESGRWGWGRGREREHVFAREALLRARGTGEGLLVFLQRIEAKDVNALATLAKIKSCAPVDPRCAAVLAKLRALYKETSEGVPTVGGWPFPKSHVPGIDVGLQGRPRKRLSSEEVSRLKKSLRRAS